MDYSISVLVTCNSNNEYLDLVTYIKIYVHINPENVLHIVACNIYFTFNCQCYFVQRDIFVFFSMNTELTFPNSLSHYSFNGAPFHSSCKCKQLSKSFSLALDYVYSCWLGCRVVYYCNYTLPGVVMWPCAGYS